MSVVENSLGPCRKPKSTISGWTLVGFHPEMALFRNLCACPVKCSAYFTGVNLRNHLFPPQGGTRNSLISLTLRKIAHFCIGNLFFPNIDLWMDINYDEVSLISFYLFR
jgi:hypothetical protein